MGLPLISVFIGDFCEDKSLSFFWLWVVTENKSSLVLSCGLGREDCELVQEELNHNSRHHGAGFPLQAGPCYGSYGIECSPKRVIQF